MKKFLIFLLVLLAASAFDAGKSPKPNFRSEEGKFAIWFEEKPEQSTQSVPTEAGEILVTMFMYEKSPAEVYIVSYNDYPETLLEGSDPVTVLEGARTGVVENIKGTVTREKAGEFSGYPSLDFMAEGEGLFLAYKLIMVDKRLYQIGILKDDKIGKNEAETFIGSFQLI